MQSDDIDDSAWPHEMSLITSHNETVFTELLFIRDSWRLPTDDRLPDLAPPPRPTATTFSDSQLIAFTNGWHAAWEKAVAWSLDAVARAQTIQSLMPGDTDALRAILPPRWTDALDDERFDHDAWSAWQQRLPRYSPTTFDDIPERRSLVALSPAWRRGLEILVILPFAGPYSRQLGSNGLLLSHESYTTPELFSASLERFAAD